MELDVIILCGGLGSRMGERSKGIPKILTDVNGKTILDRLMEKLDTVSVKRVILATSHLSQEIIDYVDNSKYKYPVYYSDSNTLLGTGGALKKSLTDHAPISSNFFVIGGDILCDVDLADIINYKKNYDGVFLGVHVEDMSEFGSLITNEEMKIVDFQEKANPGAPGLVDGSIYLFNESIASYFPKTEIFSLEYDVFPNAKKLYAYSFQGNWVDVGTPERLINAKNYFDN